MNIQDWLRGKQTAQQQTNSYNLPSLDLAFDLVKDEMKAQLDRVDGLDTKANFIMGAATGLVGIALTIQATIFSVHAHSYCTPYLPAFLLLLPELVKHALPVIPLLISCTITIIYGYRAYKIGEYASIPAHPAALYSYLEQEAIITKIDIFERMRVRFKDNEYKIDQKARRLQIAMYWFMTESFFFILFLLYQSIC